MQQIPEEIIDKAKTINGDIKNLVKQLNPQNSNNLYIYCSGAIQSFLKEDLIDRMIITRFPILLGSGFPALLKRSMN